MKTRRKVGLAVMLTVFAGLTLWWMFYVPYDPDKVYRAIPASVDYVSIHRDLSGRWETLTTNPISLSLLQSAGVDLDELAKLTHDPTFQPMLKKLAGDLMMLAYMPPTSYSRESAWLFGSWLGGGSQRLRWMLSLGIVPGYEKRVTASGRPYWVAQDSGLEEGLELSIAIEEGVLVGCISKDPGNIEQAVGAFEGSIPSLASIATSVFNTASARASTDVGWVRMPDLDMRPGTADAYLTYELVDDKAGGVRGRLMFSEPWLPEHTMKNAFAVEGLTAVLGDLPFGVLVIHPDLLQVGGSVWGGLLGELIKEQGASPTCLALLGGDYSSRFQLFKIPSLCVVSRIKDKQETVEGVAQLLDRVNAVYRLGLIQSQEFAGTHEIFIVEGTTGDLYSKLGRDQSCAYTVLDEWLLVASSKSVLQRLLLR